MVITHFYATTHIVLFRLALILKTLGFPAVPLHGQMSQSSRLGALAKFKGGGRNILVATDVASRCVAISPILYYKLTDEH